MSWSTLLRAIGPYTSSALTDRRRIGPWLLHERHEEVLKILAWCGISDEGLADNHSAIRRWGFNSAVVWLTYAKLAALIKRGEGWP